MEERKGEGISEKRGSLSFFLDVAYAKRKRIIAPGKRRAIKRGRRIIPSGVACMERRAASEAGTYLAVSFFPFFTYKYNLEEEKNLKQTSAPTGNAKKIFLLLLMILYVCMHARLRRE